MLVLFILLTLGVIGLLIFHIKRLHMYRLAAKIPGPMALPFIGNAHYFFGDPAAILDKMMNLINKYPSPARAWLGPKLFIAVSDPEQMKTVFSSSKSIEKSFVYDFLRPWLGTGLLTAPADKWHVHRRLIAPSFNTLKLDAFHEIFVQQSVILAKQMEVELGSDELDIFEYMSRCTLDIICESAMGVSINAQTDKSSLYPHAIKKIAEIVCTQAFRIWLYVNPIFNLTSLAAEQNKYLKYVHNHTHNVIRELKQQFNDTHRSKNKENQVKSEIPTEAFLNLLMKVSNKGQPFTDEELREEVDTIIAAGTDTTATVTTFLIFMLANFPEIQQKCYDELCDIYGNNINDITSTTRDDIRKIEYLERVIKETMRLFPPAPILARSISDDIELGDYTLPKGSTVVLPILQLHRTSDIWINPFEFNPDRFLPDEVAKRHPYSYVPFSAGPRNCIGGQYAMISMKTLISTLLRKYSFVKDSKIKVEDIKLRFDVTLCPIDPLTVKIKRR